MDLSGFTTGAGRTVRIAGKVPRVCQPRRGSRCACLGLPLRHLRDFARPCNICTGEGSVDELCINHAAAQCRSMHVRACVRARARACSVALCFAHFVSTVLESVGPLIGDPDDGVRAALVPFATALWPALSEQVESKASGRTALFPRLCPPAGHFPRFRVQPATMPRLVEARIESAAMDRSWRVWQAVRIFLPLITVYLCRSRPPPCSA